MNTPLSLYEVWVDSPMKDAINVGPEPVYHHPARMNGRIILLQKCH
jgi:hypothetical protein